MIQLLNFQDLTVMDLCSLSLSIVSFGLGQEYAHIEDTICTSSQASLDQAIVALEVPCIQGAAKVVVKQELPSGWKTEDIHVIIVDKMCHLCVRWCENL